MSQEKIDKRKADKVNRKKQLAKRKQKRILNIFVSVLVTVAFIAIICLAAGQLSGKFDKPTTTAAVSYSAEELASIQNALGITTTAGDESSTGSSEETTVSTEETTASSDDASETSAAE